jgi:hypothetical protein
MKRSRGGLGVKVAARGRVTPPGRVWSQGRGGLVLSITAAVLRRPAPWSGAFGGCPQQVLKAWNAALSPTKSPVGPSPQPTRNEPRGGSRPRRLVISGQLLRADRVVARSTPSRCRGR